ncbi:alpha/beta-hydrolase [Trametes polyzona]|nr:alpha/beta-hydrolase [Trametes polyzona]
MDPALYKTTTVSRGFLYNYYYSPAAAGKQTLLFIHGFPSTSYDWRRQVAHFRPQGYGLLVLDTLGAGGSAKPDDVDALRFAGMARDIVDLLDAEGVQQVVGIGHDWGSAILSRLANLYPERFHAFAWLALSYLPPSWQDADPSVAVVAQKEGAADAGSAPGDDSERFGYWEFLSRDDAYLTLESKLDCFLQLTYPVRPESWKEWLCPRGKTQQYFELGQTPGIPSWLPKEASEYDETRSILAKAGLKSFMKYYTGMVTNVHAADEKLIPKEAYFIKKPALFIATSKDYICRPAEGKAVMQAFAPQATVVELDVGHWPQLENTEGVNRELERWLGTLDVTKA